MKPMSGSAGDNCVFISYSHADRRWHDRLLEHISPLMQEGDIRVFSDRNIMVGADWHAEIQMALHAARIAVLLISAHFLASDFIMTVELPPLLAAAEKGMAVMPLIVTPSLFETMPSLSRFQAANPPSRPLCMMRPEQWHHVLADLAREIQRHVTGQGLGRSMARSGTLPCLQSAACRSGRSSPWPSGC